MHRAGRAKVDRSADDMRKSKTSPIDLPGSRSISKMEAYLVDAGDPGRAQRVSLRKQPARHVHRNSATMCCLAAVDEGTRLACVAKAQVLVVQDLCRGEAVVQFDQIEVRYFDARGFLSQLGGRPRDFVEIG